MTYGTVNADVISASNGESISVGSGQGLINRIINGAMVIDQRNAGASVTQNNSGIYCLDRWFLYGDVNSKFTAQQNAGSVTPPVGFVNYLGCTSSSAYTVGSGEQFVIQQLIEGYNIADLGWGTANAKTVTLSFQVYSSLTGTFGGSLKNNGGTRSYPFSFSIPVANTWTAISVTIAGDTTGTWLTTNGLGIRVNFSMGAGSTLTTTGGAWAAGNYNAPTGSVSVVGTSGATFYITGVSLQKGSTATSFDYRPYGTELALCQRYMFQPKPVSGVSMFPATSENGSAGGGFQTSITFPVTMRSQPSLITSGAIDSTFRLNWVFSGSSAITSVSGTHQGSTVNMTWYGVKTSAFQGAGQISFNEISSATTYVIYFQAEL